MMRIIITGSLLVALLAAAPPAGAQDTVQLTVAGREGGDCAGGQAMCLEVTQGSLSDITPGATVEVTFMNEGQAPHNLNAIELENADSSRDTPRDDAIGMTDEEQLSPGEEATFTFTAPGESSEGVYFWCDIPSHEQIGMWLEHEYDLGMPGNGNGDGNGTNGTTPLPFGWVVGALTIAGLLAVAMARRRT